MPVEAEYFTRIVSLDEIWRVIPGGDDAGRRRLVGGESATPPDHHAPGQRERVDQARALHSMQNGLLHRVHHSVYLHGQPTFLPGAIELAAVLACGESAAVSHTRPPLCTG